MTTLHLISHTHWDREWYQTFQQFRLRLVHLIDGLLERMPTDPDFPYFMLDGQTILLDDYLEVRLEKEEELRRLIQQGRILIGPWHILPDEFLVSPEATIRNLLQGDHTARRFGGKMMVGYIPDPFGHIGQMPQILRGFGIDTACLRRGLADEPVEMNWQAPDGSHVFLVYLRDGYDNAAGLPTSDPQRFMQEVRRLRDSLAAHSATFTIKPSALHLMHGTDHMEPPPDTAAAVAYASTRLGGDRLVKSTLPAYLADIRQAIGGEPILTFIGELRASKRHHLLPGVLSTRMWIKQRNRACETLLEAWAEPFTTWAESLNPKDPSYIQQPAALLHSAWRMLMECHPHDSICGCSIDQVHDEMRARFDQVEQIGEELTRQSLACLAASTNTIHPTQRPPQSDASNDISSGFLPPFKSILVFNPTSYSRSDVVSVAFELPPEMADFEIIDDQGEVVPHLQQDGGSTELIHMNLDRKGLRDAMSMIHDGRAANMVVRGLSWQRQGNAMLVQVVMATNGEPDLAAWRKALQESEMVFSDDSLQNFLVLARTPPASEGTFLARDVPAWGYRTYWLRPIPATIPETTPGEKPSRAAGLFLSLGSRLEKITRPFVPNISSRQPAAPGSPLGNLQNRKSTSPDYAEGAVRGSKPPYVIENEYLRVEVSTEDGSLVLFDRRSAIEFSGLHRFVDGGDCGDEYNFCPPDSDRLVRLAFVDSVRIEKDAVQQTIDISLHMRLPAELSQDRKSRSKTAVVVPIFSRIRLSSGVPRLEITTTVDNLNPNGEARARDHRLRVHFQAPFTVQQADYDGHFEIVRRKVGVPVFDQSWVEQPRPEKPQRLFTAITGEQAGLAIANRGLPEVEVFTNAGGRSEIALTLLRCVGWLSRDDFASRHGHAGPALPTPGAQMAGRYTFNYSVIPYPAASPLSDVYAQATAFNAPLRGFIEPLHPGVLPPSSSLVGAEPAQFAISAIKPCEDGSGWIVRGYNLGSAPLDARLRPWKPFPHAGRVALSEQPISSLETAADGSVTFPVGGHEIVTIKFTD